MSHDSISTNNAIQASRVPGTVRGPVAATSMVRRWKKRKVQRGYFVEQNRHERRDKSDSYIDQYGAARFSIRTGIALFRQ